ncbi:FAD dependent oxidoreductase [Choiromyces venosus 120613-1]|uniref:L-2-hydroxyglutarate dehydrogenase, mitochondrial n=1 Tax=Choiromyces venosus 120613-1 TaxID=1336337 RepID=A0A3N4JB12_9PEZI|nr:FAD dependent oxidoreductase [Choiromyces venosus 120613-1]
MFLRTSRRFFASAAGAAAAAAAKLPVRNDFTHCVIGGGVIGLSIARQLSKRPGTSTLLLEQHSSLGTETSSRNSEVIHAGLYYPPNSHKTTLCKAGSELLYALCEKYQIPHRRTGKWIIAQDEGQLESLERLHAHASSLDIPTGWLTPEQVRVREPAVRAKAGVLESPLTGIVDSHAFMTFLHGDFESAGGDVARGARVVDVQSIGMGGDMGYRLTITDGTSTIATNEGEFTISTDTLINAAGLSAISISNLLLQQTHPERVLAPYYCKGTYFSYSSSSPKVSTLLYPAPVKGFAGLGTHLTMDMAGRIRFGPDVEWIQDPRDLKPNESRMAAAVAAIKTYLPGLREEALAPDYCGVRPKLAPEGMGGVGEVDFVIQEEEGYGGFVNLLGIESPGLTSSLAIAEMVEGILYK